MNTLDDEKPGVWFEDSSGVRPSLPADAAVGSYTSPEAALEESLSDKAKWRELPDDVSWGGPTAAQLAPASMGAATFLSCAPAAAAAGGPEFFLDAADQGGLTRSFGEGLVLEAPEAMHRSVDLAPHLQQRAAPARAGGCVADKPGMLRFEAPDALRPREPAKAAMSPAVVKQAPAPPEVELQKRNPLLVSPMPRHASGSATPTRPAFLDVEGMDALAPLPEAGALGHELRGLTSTGSGSLSGSDASFGWAAMGAGRLSRGAAGAGGAGGLAVDPTEVEVLVSPASSPMVAHDVCKVLRQMASTEPCLSVADETFSAAGAPNGNGQAHPAGPHGMHPSHDASTSSLASLVDYDLEILEVNAARTEASPPAVPDTSHLPKQARQGAPQHLRTETAPAAATAYLATVDTLCEMEHVRVQVEVSPRGSEPAMGAGGPNGQLFAHHADPAHTACLVNAESVIHSRRVFGAAGAFDSFNNKLLEGLGGAKHAGGPVQRLRATHPRRSSAGGAAGGQRAGSVSAPPTMASGRSRAQLRAAMQEQIRSLVARATLPDEEEDEPGVQGQPARPGKAKNACPLEALALEPAAEQAARTLCKLLYKPSAVEAVLAAPALHAALARLLRTSSDGVFNFAVVAVALLVEGEAAAAAALAVEHGPAAKTPTPTLEHLAALPAAVQARVRARLGRAANQLNAASSPPALEAPDSLQSFSDPTAAPKYAAACSKSAGSQLVANAWSEALSKMGLEQESLGCGRSRHAPLLRPGTNGTFGGGALTHRAKSCEDLIRNEVASRAKAVLGQWQQVVA